MKVSQSYLPQTLFSASPGQPPVRAMIAPARYVQGPRVLEKLGVYLGLLKVRQVAVLISARGYSELGEVVAKALGEAGIHWQAAHFGGECCYDEIAAHVNALAANGVECIVSIGGGKCLDTGKAVAFRLQIPVVSVPTLASNDAPCSALAMIYTAEGATECLEYYPQSPQFVVVDSEIIARSPKRYLVAGMGDAMATWYETRACFENGAGVTPLGARPPLAAKAMAEQCAVTLFQWGEAACEALADGQPNAALENIIEANTLLSGLGFESGGIAVAHGIAQALTLIPRVDQGFLHGEMVALGTLVQLMLEGHVDEAEKVARFFITIGLPVTLEQLGMSMQDIDDLSVVVADALASPLIFNVSVPVDERRLMQSIAAADRLGATLLHNVG